MNPLARASALAIASLIMLLSITGTSYSQYAIEELFLGQRVQIGAPEYKVYNCKPSDDFSGMTRCQHWQQRSARATAQNVTKTFMHAGDGTIAYVAATTSPVALSQSEGNTEINQISRVLNARPTTIMWLPADGKPSAVITTWGSIRLEALGGPDRVILSEGKSPRVGILVDTLGNLTKSAKEGEPVFRVIGGQGYLFSVNFDPDGRGHRRQMAIDATQLGNAKFDRDMRGTLEKNQQLHARDYSLWPEVAATTRRLALDTSPTNANQQLAKVISGYPKAKHLHSQLWSVMPGGVIIGLGAGEYRKIDIYGPNTKYPEIKRNVQDFIANNSSAPFVEMAHYMNGDLQRALEQGAKSPIRTVLFYARGHKLLEALLQDVMAALKKDYPTAEDGSLLVYRTQADLNGMPHLHLLEPLSNSFPAFAARAAIIKPYFQEALKDARGPHADDAAYMLGWLSITSEIR